MTLFTPQGHEDRVGTFVPMSLWADDVEGTYETLRARCKTPLGNTLGPSLPFVGIVAQAFDCPDEDFGAPLGRILGKYAVGEPPEGSTKPNLRLLASVVRHLLGWKLGGAAWPHPYFDRATRAPNRAVTIVSPAEREALRPLCGPRAKSVAPS